MAKVSKIPVQPCFLQSSTIMGWMTRIFLVIILWSENSSSPYLSSEEICTERRRKVFFFFLFLLYSRILDKTSFLSSASIFQNIFIFGLLIQMMLEQTYKYRNIFIQISYRYLILSYLYLYIDNNPSFFQKFVKEKRQYKPKIDGYSIFTFLKDKYLKLGLRLNS